MMIFVSYRDNGGWMLCNTAHASILKVGDITEFKLVFSLLKPRPNNPTSHILPSIMGEYRLFGWMYIDM